MHSLYYWTGVIVWILLALAVGIVIGLLAWNVTVALVRTCSVLRFTLALRRKRGAESNENWVRSIVWIFKQMWDYHETEIVGKDGSVWLGVGKWTVNDEPFPSDPQPETTAE
jgi:hypothetical protein